MVTEPLLIFSIGSEATLSLQEKMANKIANKKKLNALFTFQIFSFYDKTI